jgi:hypothetical protein
MIAETLPNVTGAAIGTIDPTYSFPKYAHSNTSIPPIDPPMTVSACRNHNSYGAHTTIC